MALVSIDGTQHFARLAGIKNGRMVFGASLR